MEIMEIAPEHATLEHIPLDRLDPHPDNPRLTLRADVITALAAQIALHGFRPEYALLVRPVGDRYQVIAGHHRREAALQVGLTEVPAWVRPMDDEQAYMDLGMGNTQGELSPLEIGLHAYGAVELGKGGKGGHGGLSAYAQRIGRTKGYLSQLVAAAQVYAALQPFTQVNSWEQKTKHLYEVSRAPQEQWADLVQRLTNEDWTVEATRAAVEERLAVALTDDDLLELRRAVRRRGGTYHGERRVNDVVTRHNVTFPGQAERAYTTAALREILPSFPEQAEDLPADLAAWELHEQEALLVARHRTTGVTTEPGTLRQISADARTYQPDLDRLHAAGWSFRRDGAAWEARHPTVGAAQAERVPMLVRQADRVADAHREQQARALIDQRAWDAAEQVILTVQDRATKDALMAAFSRAYRGAQPPALPTNGPEAVEAAADRPGADEPRRETAERRDTPPDDGSHPPAAAADRPGADEPRQDTPPGDGSHRTDAAAAVHLTPMPTEAPTGATRTIAQAAPTSALPPALPGLGGPPPTDQRQRAALIRLLSAALEQAQAGESITTTFPPDHVARAAAALLETPALRGAASMLAMWAQEEAA